MSDSILDAATEELGDTDHLVVGLGVLIPLLFGIAYVAKPSYMSDKVTEVNSFLWGNLGLGYLIAVLLFLVAALVFLLGPWRDVRLGDTEPEYSYPMYFAMVFSAGIAAGIVFWGPAEAALHLNTVPPFIGGSEMAGTAAAGVGGIQYTLFHWGFSPWAIYAVVAIPIAHYAYNYDAPLQVSTLLAPLIGADNVSHPLARIVDVLAVFATLGGLGTSVGLISQQFLGGVESTFGVGVGSVGVALLVLSLAAIFTIACVTGIRRGIKRIAVVNVVVFAILGVGTLVLGPTVPTLSMGATAMGQYLVELPMMSVFFDGDWATFTVFYWAWWLSWAPFVGLFIARISRGRKISTVVLTTVGAAALTTMAWFIVMGGTAVNLQLDGVANFTEAGEALAGFVLFSNLPLGQIFIGLFLAAIITFLVTSANASTYALAMLSDHGEATPSRTMRVFWGVAQGVAAAGLIVVGGADSLQQAAIITGGPFAVIILVSLAGTLFRLVIVGERGSPAPLQEKEETDESESGTPAD